MNTISRNDTSRAKLWTSIILTGLVTFVLVASATAKIAGAAAMVDGLTHAGIPRGAIVPIAALELVCLTLYLVPRTKLLGTLLLTGYFGGAVVTHIIGRENFLPPLLIGFLVWAGAYLQMPTLRRMLPMAEVQESSDRVAPQGAPTFAKS